MEARTDVATFKNRQDVDVVIYGGSDALRYYQPLEAYNQKGFTSYNYATSAARVDSLRFFAEESRYAADPVLYCFNIRTVSMVDAEIQPSSIRNWSDSLSIFSPIRSRGIYSYLHERDSKDENIPSYFLDFIEYHENYEALGNPEQWGFLNMCSLNNEDRGFEPTHSYVPFDEPSLTDERGELTEQQFNAINQLLNYCDDNELNALFICVPYIISQEECEIINSVGDYIEERGYPFINFNNYYAEIGLDFETDFADKNHVNYLGAEKYTDYFINYLVENYDLPDHRKDENYAQWDEDYQNYAANKSEWKAETVTAVEKYRNAKQMAALLPLTESFDEWEKLIDDDYFVVIITKNGITRELSDNPDFINFESKFDIDPNAQYYTGIWENGNNTLISNEAGETEFEIGIDNGRGTDSVVVVLGKDPSFRINDQDIYKSDSAVQAVVYDKYSKVVVDNVNIGINENGMICLIR